MYEYLFENFEPKSVGAKLDNDGFAILSTPIWGDHCDSLMALIDSVPPQNCEINYGGTEKRIWDSHKLSSAVEDFRTFSNDLLKRIFGRRANAHTVLAYSNKPIPDNAALQQGRWHLDSIRSQIKVFAFLTETTERSGPLELLEGTHRPLFKAVQTVNGTYLNASSFAGGARPYQKIPDEKIERLKLSGRKTIPILCDAGNVVVVNTSAIHRARPCLEQGRYALTSYYDHF